jgi:hypothetical protein
VTEKIGLSFQPGAVTGISATGGNQAEANLEGKSGATVTPPNPRYGGHFSAGNSVTVTVDTPYWDPAVSVDPSRTN